MSSARLAKINFRVAWRRRDQAIERDAMRLWERLRTLPSDVEPRQRASELCIAAYAGRELIGVSTAVIGELPALRNRFAFFRCLVDPKCRGVTVAGSLLMRSFRVLSDWSLGVPDEGVMGMVTVHENRPISQPVLTGPDGSLALIGYTNAGAQIRLAWFDHAAVD